MVKFERKIIILAVFIILMSSATLASKFVPFINNMLLGRTFDYSKSEVGNDIISEEERKKAQTIRNDRSDIKYKMIKSSEDVRDVLDVSGQLSVKVMAGTVDVEGKGSYLKSSINSENSVEVMVQVYYKTVTKTLHDNIKLLNNWDLNGVTGKHYIRSLTYGGYLIASFKYHVSNEQEKEQIKASVKVDVNTVKAEVGVKGMFEKLASSSTSQSSLVITYSSSVISDKVPVDLPTLIKVIENFRSDMKKTNNGIGVPVLAEIGELRLLRNVNDAARNKYKFLENSMLNQKMGIIATMFHDLKVTSDALENAVEDADITVILEKKYGEFNFRLSTISDKFYKAIQTLDLNAVGNSGAKQFDEALAAYKEGKTEFLPGKYLREFRKFKESNPLGDPDLNSIRGNLRALRRRVESLEIWSSGEEVLVDLSKDGAKQYMMTGGAPDMDNLMVCFSSRSLIKDKPQTYFSYSTRKYIKTTNKWEANVTTEFKISSNKKGHFIVSRDKSVVTFTRTKVNPNDRKWHSWCFYWDNSGVTKVYKDAEMAGRKGGLAKGKNIPGGGNWIVAAGETTQGTIGSNRFKGEVTNVNVYGNFETRYFQKRVAYRVTRTTCSPLVFPNVIKSWNDFKIGVVGKPNIYRKRFCQRV